MDSIVRITILAPSLPGRGQPFGGQRAKGRGQRRGKKSKERGRTKTEGRGGQWRSKERVLRTLFLGPPFLHVLFPPLCPLPSALCPLPSEGRVLIQTPGSA